MISLNRRNSDCIPPTSGLWRCDIPDSSGEIQSLYIYISNDESNGKYFCNKLLQYSNPAGQLVNVSLHFTLHTDPRAEVPEFTISCRSYGGPATTVVWVVDQTRLAENDTGTSQVILDTSQISVYDNRLTVRGRNARDYSCAVGNSITLSDDRVFTRLRGSIIFLYLIPFLNCSCRTAHQSEDSYFWLQHYTCECDCVLEVTRRKR